MKTSESISDSDLPAFWDILIPGNAHWPSASEALGEVSDLVLSLEDGDDAWMRKQSAALAEIPVAYSVTAMQELERLEPERFGRVLSALYTAYYTSPKAQAAVVRLAEAGPREASESFDESLLVHVIANRAGQRRL